MFHIQERDLIVGLAYYLTRERVNADTFEDALEIPMHAPLRSIGRGADTPIKLEPGKAKSIPPTRVHRDTARWIRLLLHLIDDDELRWASPAAKFPGGDQCQLRSCPDHGLEIVAKADGRIGTTIGQSMLES